MYCRITTDDGPIWDVLDNYGACRNDRTGASESRIDDESIAFHTRVRDGYLALAAAQPDRFVMIDGKVSIAEVAARIKEALAGRV